MHICRWIDKGQTWDIYFVRLDGPRLFTTCRFLYFAVAAWGDEVRAEMGTVSPAEIRFVRKDSDTASSQKKWAVHVISVQMVVKIRNTKLSIAFSVKEVSVRYFSGRQVVGSQPFVKAHGLTLSHLSCSQEVVLGLLIPWAGVWTFPVANKPLGEKLALLKYLSGPLRSSSWVSRGA